VVMFIGILLLCPSGLRALGSNQGDITVPAEVETVQEVYIKGEVTRIVSEESQPDPLNPGSGNDITRQIVEVSLGDPYAGKIFTIENNVSDSNPMLGSYLRQGDRVIVYTRVDNNANVLDAHVANLDRSRTVQLIILAFNRGPLDCTY